MTLAFTPRIYTIFEQSVNLNCVSLDCRRKPKKTRETNWENTGKSLNILSWFCLIQLLDAQNLYESTQALHLLRAASHVAS